MKIADRCVVSIHYTLTNDRGEELDSSRGADPLTYLHGVGALISGLERELVGLVAGDDRRVVVQPEDGYGLVDERLIQEIPLDALAGIDGLEVGMHLQSRSPDGRIQNLVVDAIGDATATLNANHPLAGEVLHFDVRVENVREATAEEVAHGHVH
jgi:FKBP-type peptidyl-prolyl cis-trans isomerase SlyD